MVLNENLVTQALEIHPITKKHEHEYDTNIPLNLDVKEKSNIPRQGL